MQATSAIKAETVGTGEVVQSVWNDEDRDIWIPRVKAIKNAWREIEWRSVAVGLRSAALVHLSPFELVDFSAVALTSGLSVLPLRVVARAASYTARLVRASKDNPGNLFCVVATAANALQFAECWKANIHQEIGRMLGYPPCCIASFKKYWPDGIIDPTWLMALNTAGLAVTADTRDLSVNGPWQSNILLRWIGVRSVPHLPCSFGCEETVIFANNLRALARDGLASAGEFKEELLSWPVEWSAVDGKAAIAVGKSLKISASTQESAERYQVRWRRRD